ncbi:MAG TPA: hypothetical protein VG318_13600 [Actinomycetota bacterium]|nr:hypothetical protein [Actinomycetota bacterium]
MPGNLYEDLRNALRSFKAFMDANVGTVRPAYRALIRVVPRLESLVGELNDLLGRVKTEIQNLNVSAIQGLDQVSTFTEQVETFLTSARTLLPSEAATIDEITAALDVVGGLPSVDEVKGEIISLIDAIRAHLTSLGQA